MYAFSEEQIGAAAARTGLRLGTKDGPPAIVPGASIAMVLATFKETSAKAGFDQAVIYTRRGGYVEPRGEANSHAAMGRLLDDGRIEAAIDMGRYLSDRGDGGAQRQLLALARQGKLDRAEGIRHGLRAVRSGAVGAEAALGEFYALPLRQGMDPDAQEADQALFWLSMARTGKAAGENVDSMLQAVTSAKCRQNAAADKAANCTATLPSYWAMRAQAQRSMLSAESSLLALRVESEALQARNRETKKQLESLQLEQGRLNEEKKTLEGQREALEIELCGAPGCAARR